MIARLVGWIRETEAALERLAAESGKRQEKIIGVDDPNDGNNLLRVHLTCDPRQFAEMEITGLFAIAIKKHL
jgi:hypothetical protein